MNRDQRQVIVTTCMSHGLIHVFELAVPALLILIQSEFGSGDFAMGRVVTVYGLLFGLGALPAGYLVDHLGSKALLLVCLWGASLSVIGMAASPSLIWFAASAGCMGLCLSIYHPAGTALITHSMPPTGRVFALHGMAGNLGVAGASVISGTLGALLGWRLALGLLGAAGLILGLRVLTLTAPPTHEIRARTGKGHWPHFVLLLLSATFMGVVYRGVTTFLPKFLSTSYGGDGRDTAVGGALTTAALLVGLAGMYVAGRLADGGWSPARVFLTGAVLQAPFLILVGGMGHAALVPLFMGFAFFHFFTQPVGNHMVADFTPPRLRGLGYGIYFFVAFGVGSFGASLGGWISERIGLAAAFPVLSVVLVPSVAAMLALVVITSRRRAPSAGGA